MYQCNKVNLKVHMCHLPETLPGNSTRADSILSLQGATVHSRAPERYDKRWTTFINGGLFVIPLYLS